jgi:site-specific DNA-methyltransferase (adenine-specific)
MIINQDCVEWMRSQPDDSVDVVVSSPPYNIGIAYNSYGDKLTAQDYLCWQKTVWTQACRILKPTGHLFLNIAPTRKDPLLPYRVADSVPWTIQNSILWSKCIEIDGYVRGHGVVTASKKYLPNGHEMVFHFTKNGDTEIDIQASSVPYQPAWAADNEKRTGRNWRPTVNNWHIPYETCGSFGGNRTKELKGEKRHPAIFPRELVRHCLRVAGAQPEHTVYDPFGGTGTTGVVAQEFGCAWIATDLDPDYCKFAQKRCNAVK